MKIVIVECDVCGKRRYGRSYSSLWRMLNSEGWVKGPRSEVTGQKTHVCNGKRCRAALDGGKA